MTASNVLMHNIVRTSREQAQRLRLMANELKAEANRLEHRAELMEKAMEQDGVSVEKAK